jgi:hypothetical protein
MQIKLLISKQDKSFIEDQNLDSYLGILPKNIIIKASNFLEINEVLWILKSFDLTIL